MGGGARSAPFIMAMRPNDGCAKRTGAHARPEPTSNNIGLYFYITQCENTFILKSPPRVHGRNSN